MKNLWFKSNHVGVSRPLERDFAGDFQSPAGGLAILATAGPAIIVI